MSNLQKSQIAIEIVARAKLVNLQGTYNDEELLDAIESIEKEFNEEVAETLTNQDYYEVLLDWVRANVKELITPYENLYLLLKEHGVYEVTEYTFTHSIHPLETPEDFYNMVLDGEYNAKAIFKSNSPLLKSLIEEYGRKFG